MLSGYRRLRLRVVVNTVVLLNLRRDRISTEPGQGPFNVLCSRFDPDVYSQ